MAKSKSTGNHLSALEREALLNTLQTRFEKNALRHKGITWDAVQERLDAAPGKCWSLQQMEETGGEPDVVGRDEATGAIIFCDCSAETPKERRNVCYDAEALASRKEHKPGDSAVAMAEAMGISLLTEDQYRHLQELGEFDLKTSSWVATPKEIRKLGGALFGDRRYNHVFIYHNGASSYYGVRGFRGRLLV
ncbi:Protein of unknown function [Chitinophaga jiangningensis]|uniref:DUF4256 domain-containing protein n=1 Tax=Chitinophaga jiangningensis TaxID=1419482 RepID=A0A1M7CMD1_9BACT|nr:DUF4256 domain-containing protein [Chitinophaga jiangningensis]SHL68273.1 Protein of unknown function [Chitinophaga jiangningensis]